jgi:hypothetical protein
MEDNLNHRKMENNLNFQIGHDCNYLGYERQEQFSHKETLVNNLYILKISSSLGKSPFKNNL